MAELGSTESGPATEPLGADRVDPRLRQFLAVVRRLPRYLALGVNLARDDRVPSGSRAAVMLGGAYAVSPIDLVPGIIPIAGQLDDVVVLLLALRGAIRACPEPVAAEHLGRAGLTVADFDRDLAACRAVAGWLALQGLKLGGRLVAGVGRTLVAGSRRATRR